MFHMIEKLMRQIWRMRAKRHISRMKIGNMITPEFLLLDAPSGFGKTSIVREFEQKSEKVRRISCELLITELCEKLRGMEDEESEWSLKELWDGLDCIIIEDVDIVLAGKEATQKETAAILTEAIEDGTSVIVTGINIKGRIPYFYAEITSNMTQYIIKITAPKSRVRIKKEKRMQI